MNQLIDYLFGRMGKRTCPIIAIEKVYNYSFHSPWKEWFVIRFKDGTELEFIEKPKFKGE
jgi:hypothetical protein